MGHRKSGATLQGKHNTSSFGRIGRTKYREDRLRILAFRKRFRRRRTFRTKRRRY